MTEIAARVESIPWPNGRVAEIAAHALARSPRPNRDISLLAALALVSGVAGRQWNISKTGLNLYLVLLGKTGIGKEAATQAIQGLVAATAQADKSSSLRGLLGPATYASGPALIRSLIAHPCRLSVLPEFGHTLATLDPRRANAAGVSLRQALLSVWSMSGRGSVFQPIAYSDAVKNTEPVASPCLTLLGETTPDVFWQSLSDEAIEDGLLPRLLVVEAVGKRQPIAEDFDQPADPRLVAWLAKLGKQAERRRLSGHDVQNVQIDPAAAALATAFDARATVEIEQADGHAVAQLWNRAHLQALKLAAVLAVADDFANPRIDEAGIKWAIDFVVASVHTVTLAFANSLTSMGDDRVRAEILAAFERVLKAGHGLNRVQRRDRAVPYSVIVRNCLPYAAFRHHRAGGVSALKMGLDSLEREGCIEKYVVRIENYKKWGSRAEHWVCGSAPILTKKSL